MFASGVLGDFEQRRGRRDGAAAAGELRQLQDRLQLVAQMRPRHAPAPVRAIERAGRVRRDLCRWPQTWQTGRVTTVRALVAGGPETGRGRTLGRLRLADVPEASIKSFQHFFNSIVSKPRIVAAGGWAGYGKFATVGYAHEAINVVISFGNAASYLEEFLFSFNQRTAKHQPSLRPSHRARRPDLTHQLRRHRRDADISPKVMESQLGPFGLKLMQRVPDRRSRTRRH